MRQLVTAVFLLLLTEYCFGQQIQIKIDTIVNDKGIKVPIYIIDKSNYQFILDSLALTKATFNTRLDLLKDSISESNRMNSQRRDKESYEREYKKFKNSVKAFWEVYKLNTAINGEISKDYYNLNIQKINNPESGILGFTLSKVLTEMIDSLTKKVTVVDKDQKSIFVNSVSKLASAGAQSLPGGALISLVINHVSGYVPPAVKAALKDPFGKTFIQNMNKSLENYYAFYNTAYLNGTNYELLLKTILVKYSRLSYDLDILKKSYETNCKIDFSKPLDEQIEKLFDYENHKSRNFNYQVYIESELVKASSKNINLLLAVSKTINDFYADYNSAVTSSFNDNKIILELAKGLKKADKKKIEVAIADLNASKSGGKLSNGTNAVGFDHTLVYYYNDMNNFINLIL